MVVGLLLLVAALLALVAPAVRADEPVPDVAPTAVVRPGDTLWSIAERQLPGHDPFAVIAEIRRLNGLTDYTVYAGQLLVLPLTR